MTWWTLDEEAGLIDYLESLGKCETDIIGTSVQGRPVRLLRVGDPPPPYGQRAGLMYTGAIHGNEPAGREAILEYAHTCGGPYGHLPGGGGNHISTPHAAALNVTESLEIRVDARIADWTQTNNNFISKYLTTGNQRSWRFGLAGAGNLRFGRSTDGANFFNTDSTAALPVAAGERAAVRMVFIGNNGADEHVVTFYHGPSVLGPWTQLGDEIVTAGAQTIFASTADVEIGSSSGGTSHVLVEADIYAIDVVDLFETPVTVANPRFQLQTPGAGSFADAAGNTWTMNGLSVIADDLSVLQRDFLTEWGLHLMPTLNPDGFVAGTRQNANGVDLNRDHISIAEVETRHVHRVQRDHLPAVHVDLHERQSGTLQLVFAGSLTPSTHSLIFDRSIEVITDMKARAGSEGWTNGDYTPANNDLESRLRNNTGLQHIVGLNTETLRADETPAGRALRTAQQLAMVDEGLLYTMLNIDDVLADIATARVEVAVEGGEGTEPFDLTNGTVLDPPPLAYRITGLTPSFHLDVFGIQVTDDGIVTMAQAAQPLIPFIFDQAATYQVVTAVRLFSLEPEPIQVSDPEFAEIIQGSFTVVLEARVLETYQDGPSPVGVNIPLNNGEIVFDGTAKTRADGWVRTPGEEGQDGPNRWPRGKSQLFAPFGNEVFVRYGIDLNTEVLWTPLGYYRITALEQPDASDRPITMFLHDRMSTIRDSELLQPRIFAAGRSVGSIFVELVGEIYPDAQILFDDDSVDATLGRQLIIERDRHEGLLELATALGKIMYWDTEGVLRVEDAPSEEEIRWEVRSGWKGVLIDSRRQLTRQGTYNAWVVTGEGADSEGGARGVALNIDPNSPTFFGGRFGRVPRFFSSTFITTDTQARRAAAAGLRRTLGAPYNLDFTQVPNPRIRPNDVIRLTHKNGDRDIHIIESVTIPLNPEQPIKANTREKTVIAIEFGGVDVG